MPVGDPEVVQVVVTDTPYTNVKVQGVDTALFAYHHVQAAPDNIWTIRHRLGFYPNVTVVDSSGAIAEGEIEYQSKNQLRITFSAPFSGDAYLS